MSAQVAGLDTQQLYCYAESFSELQSSYNAVTEQLLAYGADISNLLEQLRGERNEACEHFYDIISRVSNEDLVHGFRIARSAEIVAASLGKEKSFREAILMAAPLHDIGMLSIPDKVRKKFGKLSSDEIKIMHEHCLSGSTLLSGNNPYIKMAREISLSHHENFDGSGYPNGLKGNDIPLSARIVAICDAFESKTHNRPYYRRGKKTVSQALEMIVKDRGIRFDPQVMDVFIDVVPEIMRAMKEVDGEFECSDTDDVLKVNDRLFDSVFGTSESLVAELSHHMNNLLAVVSLSADNIKRKPQSANFNKSISFVNKAVTDMARIMWALQLASRQGIYLTQKYHAPTIIRDSFSQAFKNISQKIILSMKLDEIPSVELNIDKNALSKCVAELADNAMEAFGANVFGRINVQAYVEEVDSDSSLFINKHVIGSILYGSYLVVQIENSGYSVARDQLPELCKAFVSSKTSHRGIGITIASMVLINFGGGLVIESGMGEKTVVRMLIPIA